jgi:D,D-heptose 1,7-bisphosphate phosphatase
MKAVILAGGKGTRLRRFAKNVPKPMVKVGGMPILEHQIRLLARYGIKDTIMITGHLSWVIEQYFKDGRKFGVNIEYYIEDQPLGTTGGVKEIEDKLNTDFVLFYGDVMINMNLRKLINFHKTKNATCTLVLHPNDHPYDSDLVEIDHQQRIIKFYPKPHPRGKKFNNLVNAGIYVMSPRILKHIEKAVKADFGKDIFPRIVNEERMYGYKTAEYLKDIGTSQRFKKVNQDYLTGKIERRNSENPRPAIFMDRDGVINEKVGLLHRIQDFKLLGEAGKAVKRINDSEFLAIVITNQPVIARNLCSIEELEEVHKEMDTLLGKERAMLDAVYYCPHHPDKGYLEENPQYKIKCNCRKPKVGMIKQAQAEFNIDMQRSFLIGDSFRDILCGNNAGLTTIAVRTGDGCKDGLLEPDYFFENLSEAVDFIVDDPYRPYFERICDEFSRLDKRPFIISVGGNSRSGKTTFATYITKKFEAAGTKVLKVNLDHWLLSENERTKEHTVYERFQLDKIHRDLLDLLHGKKLVLNRYNPLSRWVTESKVSYELNHQDVVIIEGVIALACRSLSELSALRVFCEVSDDLMHRRLVNFYVWKGLGREKIHELIHARTRDEYRLIKKNKLHADIVVRTK